MAATPWSIQRDREEDLDTLPYILMNGELRKGIRAVSRESADKSAMAIRGWEICFAPFYHNTPPVQLQRSRLTCVIPIGTKCEAVAHVFSGTPVEVNGPMNGKEQGSTERKYSERVSPVKATLLQPHAYAALRSNQ